MEIEVGEWARTNTGIIDKVIKIKDLIYIDDYGTQQVDEYCIFKNKNCYKLKELKDNIANHSFNIIDLIEMGDIVDVLVNEKTNEILRYTLDNESDLHLLRKGSIVKILTHEQFETNCFKVKE